MKKSQGALENRAATALNMVMTEYQTSTIIADCEKRITDHKLFLQGKEGPLQEAFEKYEKMQNEYDYVKSRLTQDEMLLDSMTRYKNGLGKTKAIRIVRAESHNNMKDKEKKKYGDKHVVQFKWTDYATEVLKEQNKMMLPDDLWKLVYDKYDVGPKLEAIGNAKKTSNIKWSAINICWLQNCVVSKSDSRFSKLRGRLFDYNGYLGLKDWATEDWKPKAPYATQQVMMKRAI